MSTQTPAKQLFDLLVSRDFDPEMLDVKGMPAQDPSKAELFNFDFRAESGKDYGTVVIMLGDDNNFEVYFGDNVGRTMEGQDKNDWYQFLQQLKHFAVKNFMSFSPKNINRLRYSMQGQAAIKEGLFESWTGTRTTSWNGKQTEARLMIRHKKTLGENDARYRYIESLFIETGDGERYKLPFTKLSGGRAMVEHVRQGGKPYDIRGQHIVEIVEELNVLSRFKRANQGKIFEGDTAQLVEQTNTYYETAQKTLKSLSTRKGYTNYFESWNPAEITEQEVVIEGLKHLFVTQSIDTRIESALPLLAKIQQQGNAMKEANIFEAWADRLMEGTWQLPDTPEKQDRLIELMSQDLPVGADATNATEQLYDLLGDDELFDQLEALADRDANADARQVVYDRLQQLSDHPEVLKVVNGLNIDADVEMNPPEATNPADLEPMNESRLMDAARETIEHILNRFKHEVKTFEQGGDLDEDLYHALFDYYSDAGEMPYGVQKARTGDPYEWVTMNLDSYLKDSGIVGGNPDEDYGMERESVGDYADEYQDSLGGILKSAGVPAREPHSVDGGMDNPLIQDEGAIGGALGAIAGTPGGPAGAALGSAIGSAIGDKVQKLVGDDEAEDQLNEVTPDEMAQAEWLKDPKNREAQRYQSAVNNRDTNQQLTTKGRLDSQASYNLRKAVDAYKDAVMDIENNRSNNRQFGGAVGGAGAAGGAGSEPTNASDTMGQQITDIIQKAQNGQMDAGQAIAFINKQTQQVKSAPVAQTATPAPAMEEDMSLFDDATCNMTEAGENCSVHGMEECYGADTSPLAGQYGHSGKMKEVSKDISFLDRLKELSGMKK